MSTASHHPTPVIVDLSHYQRGTINYAQATAAGLAGIVHKATEGSALVDALYAERRREAAQHGVPFGSYHFARPTRGSARAQAAYFLKTTGPVSGDLCVALDIETAGELTPAQLDTWARNWGRRIRRHHPHIPLWLYTPYHLPKAEAFFDFVWRPRYNNVGQPPTLAWDIWQYSNGVLGLPNRLPGLPFAADLSHLRSGLNARQLRARIQPTHKPTPPKPPTYKPSKGMAAAIDRAAAMAKQRTDIGIGMCGKSVRIAVTNDPNSPSLGATAMLKMARVELHRESDWSKIPNGSIVWGGPGSSGAGHVAFKDLGSGPGRFDGRLLTPGSPENPDRWTYETNWADLQKGWPKDKLIGWSPDIDGCRP